ncbi:unnamed protein product [Rhizophagus irregularis]|nr:unnamed protein product [Rhizophagus irregularis]
MSENNENNDNISERKKKEGRKKEVGCGNDLSQMKLIISTHQTKVTPHRNSRQNELYKLLTDWIILDVQPLNIVHLESFRKFIKELDPAFIMPDVKLVKQIIHRSYNSTFPLVQEFINNNSISINLTTDM